MKARLALAGLALLAACDPADEPFARASVIDSLGQAIGGPKATARVGDMVLENDRMRVVIEQAGPSRLPLGKGGSVIDVDLNRTQKEFRSGFGRDQIGQLVPVANLSQAEADVAVQARITPSRTGAEVTVAAEGAPVLPIIFGLTALLNQRFSATPVDLRLYNEYELRPGEQLLRITTTIGYGVPFCPVQEGDGCNAECQDPIYDADCACDAVPARCQPGVRVVDADPLPDRDFGGILNVLLGDIPTAGGRCADATDCAPGESCEDVTQQLGGELKVCRAPDDREAGVLLGDMLIFAKDTDAFFRGPGFDSESDIRRLFDAGFDTLQNPLDVDAVYAVGDGVSYGYTAPHGSLLVPVLSGPFSMGAPAAATCRTDEPGCLDDTVVRFERWLSVGEGDVSSAFAPIARARERDRAGSAPTGRVTGTVAASPSGEPVSGARVFALRDPRALPCDGDCARACDLGDLDDAGLAARSLDEVLAANRCRSKDSVFLSGQGGLESMALTDPVGDPVRDGGFEMLLPPGRWVLVAAHGLLHSGLAVVEVTAGETARAAFLIGEPGHLDYAILDQSGQPSAGKITVGRCLPGAACADDGDCAGDEVCEQGSCACARSLPLPLELGGARQIDGVWAAEHTQDGTGSLELPAGRYEVVFSRGPDFSIDRQTVVVEGNTSQQITGRIARVVDRRGWSSADFHVHAAPSLDSDVPLEDRVIGMIATDMDFFTSTDHDTITDYGPVIQALDARRDVGAQIGLEVSPLDFGHFIGYPLTYQAFGDVMVGSGDDARTIHTRLPGNGAFDWHGLAPTVIFDLIRALKGDGEAIVHLAHPYSYFDAYRVDPFTLEPTSSFLTVINPLVDPAFFDGKFDAMELMNSENVDLLRRPTVGEVRFFSQGFYALTAMLRAGEIGNAEFDRRVYLHMLEANRRMLQRTASEQEAAITGAGNELECTCGADGDCASGLVCDPATMTCAEPPGSGAAAAPDDALCRTMRGVIDDWFVMLNRGVVVTGLSGSDVHGQEAGFLRTMLKLGPTSPPNIASTDVTKAIRERRAVVTTGPMIDFTIDQVDVGGSLSVDGGGEVELRIKVQKAPWYDVDRVEVYRNGRLIHWAVGCDDPRGGDGDEPHDHPCVAGGEAIVAYEDTFRDAPGEDAWYVVSAIGIDGRSLAPVFRSVGLPRFGTGEVTQKIFDLIPLLRSFRTPRAATVYPILPWAITNPIWVDVGGDGWDPPEAPPSWCRAGDYGC